MEDFSLETSCSVSKSYLYQDKEKALLRQEGKEARMKKGELSTTVTKMHTKNFQQLAEARRRRREWKKEVNISYSN